MALFCVISTNSGSFRAHCVIVHVRYLISWWALVTLTGRRADLRLLTISPATLNKRYCALTALTVTSWSSTSASCWENSCESRANRDVSVTAWQHLDMSTPYSSRTATDQSVSVQFRLSDKQQIQPTCDHQRCLAQCLHNQSRQGCWKPICYLLCSCQCLRHLRTWLPIIP